ncbi:MAG: hypothetical protein Nk1A_3870 [Endomicrobiia bacterium]|nr:MAG: hypothetical protein Nk1A_3870 [Endomicrobiia bacterium]
MAMADNLAKVDEERRHNVARIDRNGMLSYNNFESVV